MERTPLTISGNPFAEFRSECEAALAFALKKTLPEIKVEALAFSKPPNPEFGQLASSLSFELFGSEYGFLKTDKPVNMVVEHTSVNPLHPIHIGQARNPMLGDALARILTCRGHTVHRHYYIDDVGRQSSVVAYGYIKLGKPKPDEKSDNFVGKIYTVHSCIVEINRLKKTRENAIAIHNAEDLVK